MGNETYIDRRPNPTGRSIANRQRFLQRIREDVKRAVRESIRDGSVSAPDKEGQVKVRTGGLSEPSFQHASKGDRDHIIPGDGSLKRGDRIPRPKGGSGGSGTKGGRGGDGEDAFEFTLTRQEWLDAFFEDMELPRLARTELGETHLAAPRRAGLATEGPPSSLDLRRTALNGLARRVALRRPRDEDLERLQVALEDAKNAGDKERQAALEAEIEQVSAKLRRVPWLDPFDMRYVRREPNPQPATEAVAFMLMDVSASMGEREKDLAKRFFLLLHLFLEKRYEKVHVVFIRHTDNAQEVDEETFFRSRDTGGTVVSSALQELLRIQAKRYPTSRYNIYVAQASDGDNWDSDCDEVASLMTERILPLVRYFAYVETARPIPSSYNRTGMTTLWETYCSMEGPHMDRMAMRSVSRTGDIWAVFADLFAKRPALLEIRP